MNLLRRYLLGHRLCTWLLAMAAATAGPARAHDTWFERLPDDGGGSARLALGTGNLFPLHETPIGAEYLRRRGCHAADGAAAPGPSALAMDTSALLMTAPASSGGCWVQVAPFEVTLAPELVTTYLLEVRPPPAVLDTWATLRAQGLPWRERYTKHARIALQRGATPAAEPPLGLDALIEADTDAGLVLRVLRDGAPLPGFAVELRHERAPVGLWRRTDGDGRLHLDPGLPGAWLLRGIDLRPSTREPGTWDSRFVTLAFSR